MIEDIFAENLVDEPDDIERVIEDGDELRRDSDRESDDDEKKKDQEEKEKEKPKIKKNTGPRIVLNDKRLKGPRGIATMEDFFSSIKLDGRRGKEEKDLDVIMKRLELWTHRLYPRGQFDDCLKKIEKLGSKKLVMNYVKRIRLGLEDGSGTSELIRDEPNSPPPAAPHEDPFDQLLSSAGEFTGPAETNGSNTEITSEQRDRMLRNRLIAEERRAARIKKAQELKERFMAQQASNYPGSNGEVSEMQSQNKITQEQQENSNGASQMEVDDNHTLSNSNVNNYQKAEDRVFNEIDKESNKAEVQSEGNEEGETSLKLVAEESSMQEAVQMVIDAVKQKEGNSLDNFKETSEENVSQNNATNSNGNEIIEEMEICEDLSAKENFTHKKDLPVVLIEEHILEDKEILAESQSKVKVKETNVFEDQKENGDQSEYFEKENENPN